MVFKNLFSSGSHMCVHNQISWWLDTTHPSNSTPLSFDATVISHNDGCYKGTERFASLDDVNSFQLLPYSKNVRLERLKVGRG